MWLDHVRISSTMRPKDFTNFTLLILQSPSPTIRYGLLPGPLSKLQILFGVPMIMNSVLTVLILNLLNLSHLQIFENAGTRCSLISLTPLKALAKLVSSANIVMSTFGRKWGINHSCRLRTVKVSL